MSEKPTVTKSSSAFRLEYAVTVRVRASAAQLWGRLTRLSEVPSWNSTVKSCEGEAALGRRVAIEVFAAPGRVFRPTVTELEAERRMVWSDGQAPFFKGVRTYTLEPGEEGTTVFTMREVFTGVMLPMIKGSLPDFAPIFERYAEDLARACESAS